MLFFWVSRNVFLAPHPLLYNVRGRGLGGSLVADWVYRSNFIVGCLDGGGRLRTRGVRGSWRGRDWKMLGWGVGTIGLGLCFVSLSFGSGFCPSSNTLQC